VNGKTGSVCEPKKRDRQRNDDEQRQSDEKPDLLLVR
jgi:hypothetical protein